MTARHWLRRVGWVSVLLPLLATALGARLATTDAFVAGENLFYDVRLRTFNVPPPRSPDILILALDDTTVQDIARNKQYSRNYGKYPYARRLWARVLDHLMSEGARAVMMDSVMDEPDPVSANDDALAQLISERHVPFYLGFDLTQRSGGAPVAVPAVNLLPGDPALTLPEPAESDDADPFAKPALPAALTRAQRLSRLVFPVTARGVTLPALTQYIPQPIERMPQPPIDPVLRVGAGFGLVLPEEDRDGRLRRTRLAYSDGVNTYVTLPLAMAADLLHADHVELSPGKLTVGNRTLQLDAQGDAEVDYAGTIYQRFDTIPLVRVLNDWDAVHAHQPRRLPEGTFRDKIVVIGAFALGTYDVKSTPFAGETVGVTKPAVELATLLSGRFITKVGTGTTWALTLLFALIAAVCILSSRAIWVELLFPLAGLGLMFVGTGLVLTRLKLHVPFMFPAGVWVLTSLGAITFNHLFANREREKLRAIFSRYLAKQVADQLATAGELPRLDGESREITAFFSDIRSFSTFSEGFRENPRGLVKLLNTYLTRVSGTLQDHGACLDKYIGDAVVCIFGAPLKNEHHAIDACRAALRVQEEIQQLRGEFKAQGLPDVYTRIGMNTAVMFVGNFGSEQLFSYTAMGDGMNLASRLEGANKAFGTLIMIGERTYEQARETIEARELDWVKVAGKNEATRVYELMALKGQLPEAKRRTLDLYARALALYRAAQFQEALEVLRQAEKDDPEDGPTQTMIHRCEGFLASPPKLPFDGIAKLDK